MFAPGGRVVGGSARMERCAAPRPVRLPRQTPFSLTENLDQMPQTCPNRILSGQTRPAYICRAQTSPGQNAGQVCGICKFSFARKSSDTAAVPGAELRSAPSGRNAGRRFYEKRCKSAASFIADSGAVRYNRNIPARHTGTFLLQIGYALQNGRGEAEYGSME